MGRSIVASFVYTRFANSMTAGIGVLLLAVPCFSEKHGPKDSTGTQSDDKKAASPLPVGSPTTDKALWPTSLGGGKPFELLIRGDRSRFGRYDADGNFIPEPFHESMPPGGPISGIIAFRFTNHVRGPLAVAEHRSGRLLLGTMIKGIFVPELRSRVLDMTKDFDVKNPARIIYNLHDDAAAKFWTEKQRKEFPGGLPKVEEPPEAGAPVGWSVVEFRDVALDMKDRWQIRVIGEVAEFGDLDERGEFIPDYGLPIVKRDGLLGSQVNRPDLPLPRRYYTLPADGAKTEEVYEFRSGRLIKGTLHKTGNFVPEIGSTILNFKDYDPYSRRRIYNLPGVLRKVEKKEP